MNLIAEGVLQAEKAVEETLGELEPLCRRLRGMQGTWLEKMREAMEEHRDLVQVGMEDGEGGRRQGGNEDNTNFGGGNRALICYTCN